MFEKDCTVRFVAGSRLEFGEAAFMIIKGKTYFPEKHKVVFTGKDDKNWGGVLLSGATEQAVQYAEFSRGNEFLFEGKKDIRAP